MRNPKFIDISRSCSSIHNICQNKHFQTRGEKRLLQYYKMLNFRV